MNYRRALVLTDLRADPAPALAALRAVAPGLTRVVVLGRVRGVEAWWSTERGGDADPRELALLTRWRAAAAAMAPSSEVRPVPALASDAVVDLALGEDVDLLVAGGRSLETARLVTGVGRRIAAAVLWPAGEPRDSPVRRVFCAAVGQRSLAAVTGLVRDHAEAALEVAIAGPAVMPSAELAALLRVLGVRARVQVLGKKALPLGPALEAAARAGPVDLVVLARAPALLLLGYQWPAPVLLVPAATAMRPRARGLDLCDVVEAGGVLRVRIDEVSAVGALAPAADVEVAFVSEGRVVQTALSSPWGEVELPAMVGVSWLGGVRVGDEAPDPLAAVAHRLAVLRPGGRPLLLFDAELPDEQLARLREVTVDPGLEALAVRLRPTRRSARLRRRLELAGIPSHVIDARAVLDEGEALDVAEANDAVRLNRVAARLRGSGFPVVGVLHSGITAPAPVIDTPAVPIAGNRVELELDNARARTWLLDEIARSRESVSLQVYIAADDEVGRAVEGALAAAGARGVSVRVLVDSLHGQHGSFGAENPLLARLATRPGVEVRVARPVTSLPSVADLKLRDHRKVVVVDGRVALVGGRNLAHEYYTGFDEVRLTEASPWRQVPWLDAGARLEGPAVAEVASSFLEAWTGAGGAPFSIERPALVGSTATRVVVHHGLADARTLEAYLDLVEGARSHIYATSGFPLLLELQHALVRAVSRGVRVSVLLGQASPTYEGTPFEGPWTQARVIANELVHSRVDPIVEAGGEVHLFAQRGVAGWAPALGLVHPYVHAKLMSADGRRCAIGSANLDVTSAYWESELMLVVEDAAAARGLELQLEALIAASMPVQRDDPGWRERAARRSWMRRWPGVLGV